MYSPYLISLLLLFHLEYCSLETFFIVFSILNISLITYVFWINWKALSSLVAHVSGRISMSSDIVICFRTWTHLVYLFESIEIRRAGFVTKLELKHDLGFYRRSSNKEATVAPLPWWASVVVRRWGSWRDMLRIGERATNTVLVLKRQGFFQHFRKYRSFCSLFFY